MNFILFYQLLFEQHVREIANWNEVINHGFVVVFWHILLHSYHGNEFIGIGQKQHCSGLTLCKNSMDYIGIKQASQKAPMINHHSKGSGMDVADSLFNASLPNTYHQQVWFHFKAIKELAENLHFAALKTNSESNNKI